MKQKVMVSACVIFILATFQLYSQDWSFYDVDVLGKKPSIAVDGSDVPHIVYIQERSNGWVKYAKWNPGSETFSLATAHSGNFYGPPAIATDQNNLPHLNYHDHGIPGQSHAWFNGTNWIVEPINSSGHDGWSNSIVIGSNNLPHTSSVDPRGITPVGVGVEYAWYDGTNWHVEAIGSEPDIEYYHSTSLALDASDNPHISYYNDITQNLMYATKSGGSWNLSIVDANGDAGKFSSLKLNSLNRPRISYYESLTANSGAIKYAQITGSGWAIQTVDTLHDVFEHSTTGARNITSLDLDSQDNAHITYADRSVVKYASNRTGSWVIETLRDASASTKTIGQGTSISLDSENIPHVTFYEVRPATGSSTVDWVVYGKKSATSIFVSVDSQFDPIPAAGDTIPLNLSFANYSNVNKSVDLWINMEHPDGVKVTPVISVKRPQIISNQTVGKTPMLGIPDRGDPGEYTVVAYMGAFPSDTVSTDTVRVTKAAAKSFANGNPQKVNVLPQKNELLRNYPNPFNPITNIEYRLVDAGFVELSIFNVLGQKVRTLAKQHQEAGSYSVEWDGKNNEGIAMPSGIYIYQIRSGSFQQAYKMFLNK